MRRGPPRRRKKGRPAAVVVVYLQVSWIGPVAHDSAATETDRPQNLQNRGLKAQVKNWQGKLVVAKVPRALLKVAVARVAQDVPVDGAQARVREAPHLGLPALVRRRLINQSHARPRDLVRRERSELDAVHALHGRARKGEPLHGECVVAAAVAVAAALPPRPFPLGSEPLSPKPPRHTTLDGQGFRGAGRTGRLFGRDLEGTKVLRLRARMRTAPP